MAKLASLLSIEEMIQARCQLEVAKSIFKKENVGLFL